LQINDLSVGYQDHKVIENIDLSIEQGKVYSIIGPNGCGKTTLMRTISRSIKPSSGTVLLDGQNIFKMSTRLVAQKIGILSQNNATMSDITVRTLVQYGRFAHKKWWCGGSGEDTSIVDWALEKTGMTNYSNRRINSLSGGERQRVEIARVLACNPSIIIMDEATSALDARTEYEISKHVRERGITCIIVAHRLSTIRDCDEIIVLDQGHVVERGKHDELMRQDGLYRKLIMMS